MQYFSLFGQFVYQFIYIYIYLSQYYSATDLHFTQCKFLTSALHRAVSLIDVMRNQ